MKRLVLAATHAATLVAGFALGVYMLPILTAPDAPTAAAVQAEARAATHRGQFRRDLKGSDALHWGDGVVSVGARSIALEGELSPGPDYKLYLSPAFVETEADFLALRARMVRVGDVKTFRNFLLPVPEAVDVGQYTTVVVWCETFGQFITAAQYRP